MGPGGPERGRGALPSLTRFVDPLGVGVVFATAQDAATFDTLYEGNTITVLEGTYTCGNSVLICGRTGGHDGCVEHLGH